MGTPNYNIFCFFSPINKWEAITVQLQAVYIEQIHTCCIDCNWIFHRGTDGDSKECRRAYFQQNRISSRLLNKYCNNYTASMYIHINYHTVKCFRLRSLTNCSNSIFSPETVRNLPIDAVTTLLLQCQNATIPATSSIIFMVTPPSTKPALVQSEGCTEWIRDDCEFATL